MNQRAVPVLLVERLEIVFQTYLNDNIIISLLNYVALHASISKTEPRHLLPGERECGHSLVQKFHHSAFVSQS